MSPEATRARPSVCSTLSFANATGGPATIAVALETATATYTGDTVAALGTALGLHASVAEPIDGSRSNIALAQVRYDIGLRTGSTVTPVGSVTVAAPGPNGDWAGAYAAPSAAVYELTVTVVGPYYSSPASVVSLVAVYDPSAGFVTGGGWISSPSGAEAAAPTVSGRANFGLNAKYQSGSTVPTGQTEFQFQPGNLNLHSTGYAWLVISGTKAQYQGAGTISGSGTASFLVTVIDGQPDRVRVKIWDSSGAVIYDSQPGDSDDANPTTAIGGGSIVVH